MAYGDMMANAGRRRRSYNWNDSDAGRASLVGAQGDAYGTAAGYGDTATGEYLNRAMNFDPSAALNTYAKGAWGSVSAGLDQTLERLKGEAGGSGRLQSGFFDLDQGDVIRNVTNDFTNNLSQQALGAAGMMQRNTEGLGAFGERQQGMATDLLMSRREEIENAKREADERKRKRRSGIGSAIGGVLGAGAGALFGGTTGAKWGYTLGSGVGGAF